jgi:Gnt-I system high-affinity gluconate transporter
MLIAVLAAIYFLGLRRGKTMPQVMQWLQDAISGIAMILLIITAGGVFKQVIIDSGTGKYITGFASQWNISPLIFAWVVTALLRVAIGSASVAGITAAGIVLLAPPYRPNCWCWQLVQAVCLVPISTIRAFGCLKNFLNCH